ncbi:MAG: tRNA (guanosine(46)-N7)-methyltransferase TrmB [Proteobacteria bacterium]|nr:tRNA (guanosine(46)-N7)-methyltransferase TrmB [Pseudomonadota bacterium]
MMRRATPNSATAPAGAHASPRQGAFFGRRKGHRLRAHHAALFETALPRLAIDLAALAQDGPRAQFASSVDAVRLEIGFGGGEHLIAQAQAHPQSGFLGCEPFVNGMAKILAHIEGTGVANVRLYFGDAIDLLAALPSACLERVDILYPDPWPKRRHWKRRFVQDARVAQLAELLRPGGEWCFATDDADYAAWTLERALRSRRFAWLAETADDWRQPWPGYCPTRYERKARGAGRQPCYLRFRRPG